MSEEIVNVTEGAELLKAASNGPTDDFARSVAVTQVRPDQDILVLSRWQSDRWRSFGEQLSIERVAAAVRAADEGDVGAEMALKAEMLERDPTLAAVAQTRTNWPGTLARDMIPAQLKKPTEKTLKLAQEIADDCQAMIDAIPEFDSWLIDFFDAIGKSFSLTEKIYRADATIAALKWINPTLLSFEPPDGALTITILTPDFRTLKIRCADYPWKWVIHRSKTRSGHPARGGVLRTIIWPYVFRNYGMRDWSVFCERFGMPMRVGKYGPGATPGDKAILTDMVEHMGSESWAVISEKTQIEFKELAARGMEPFSAFYRAMGNEYALGWLGQTATSLVNEYGTRGDTAVKQMVRQDLGESDCKQGEATLRRDILFPYVLATRGEEIARTYTPTLHFKYEPPADLTAQVAVDKVVLLEFGVGRLTPVKRIAERYGIAHLIVDPDDPEFDPDEMVIGETPEPDPDDPEGGGGEEGEGDDGKKKPPEKKEREKQIEYVSIPTHEGVPIRVAKGDLVHTENRGYVREYELRNDDVVRLQPATSREA